MKIKIYQSVIIVSLMAASYFVEADSRGQAGLVTVGQDSTCDYRTDLSANIQDAINDGAEIIRVVSGIYRENLVIENTSLEITGGFADCDDALNDVPDGNKSNLLAADSAQQPIRISSTANALGFFIELNRLTLQGARLSGTGRGGGLSIRGDLLNVLINNTNIQNNVAGNFGSGLYISGTGNNVKLRNSVLSNNNGSLFGGGMAVVGDDNEVMLIDAMIAANNAQNGGGIYCGGENNIVMDATEDITSGLMNNAATNGNGGGALLVDQCRLSSYLGMSSDEFQSTAPSGVPRQGIIENRASRHGGGVAVFDEANFRLVGLNSCDEGACEQPASMLTNTADSDTEDGGRGGAIYAADSGTKVYLNMVDLRFNQANSGGAIALENGAQGDITRYINDPCWSEDHCNRIDENVALGSGGAIWVDDADLNSEYVHYSNNSAQKGVVAIVTGENGLIKFDTNLMHNNGFNPEFPDLTNRYLIANSNQSGAVIINQSTLADNTFDDQFSTVLLNIRGTLDVFNSIIHEPETFSVFGGSDLGTGFDCVMVHEDESIPRGNSFRVRVDDPLFLNRQVGDYHLDPVRSPAIDFCDKVLAGSSPVDMDLQLRGSDNPAVDNFEGFLYDLGFDETDGFFDLIYKNGFEVKR